MSADDRIEAARLLYERAVFTGDADALTTADRELDGVEADLALARGRIIHTRFLERSRQLADSVGDKRAAAIAQSAGADRITHQVDEARAHLTP
jgi:hypothetical protein